jgi:sugar phosphate isomerase/epimerase
MNPALFVHVPAQLLPARLNFLRNRRLQPEVACQDVSIDQLDAQQLGVCAAELAAAQLGTTLHAPFASFNPGSSRRRVRKYSRELALKSLQLAEAIKAKRIIFHPGIPYGGSAKQLDFWLQQNIDFWPEFISMAEALNCCICIENIYEAAPDSLLALCRELASPNFGHCFDIGHWNIFGTVKLRHWLEQAAPWLKHLHLHDNCGDQDEHLPIGQGYASFSTLFAWLKETACTPTFTLEAHNLPDLDMSLTALEQYLT